MKITQISSSGAPPYPEDFCPVCRTKAVMGCRCCGNGISNDRTCANNHTWYWDHGKVIIGSHHTKQPKG